MAAEQLHLLWKQLDAAAAEPAIPDQRLALMFVCAHPAIDRRSHARETQVEPGRIDGGLCRTIDWSGAR